jgi:uncharacterized protein (TIGR02996 family)
MSSSHDALYRAICAHPDEDTPRLAFADLVEERGDELRARFIRTQVALARVPEYDPEWVKARQFDPDAATGWLRTEDLPRPLPAGASWQRFEFRRGFPWKVGVSSLRDFVGCGEAVFGAAPVQALDIDAGDRPDLSALAEWPHLARLRKLEFSDGWFGADGIAPLTESEFAANVTELGFEFAGVAPEGLAALAASELFPRLTGLELRSINVPGALVADSLAEARGPGALSRLALPYNRFGRDDAEQLFALPLMRQLQHLDLSDNRLGVQGATALAESGIARRLRILNLGNTRPGVPGVKALAEAGGLGGLRMLDLSHNALGPVAVKALANCGSLRGLRVLNLTNNLGGDAGAAALAGSRALSGLLELDLRDAGVGDSGAQALAESPHLENLLRLDLRARDGRPLGAGATRVLFQRFGDRVSI